MKIKNYALVQGGFTLAELLMAVLVISIIMVALAPVITRRAYDNVSIEVNKKKGLEIYTNPGIYTFDVPVGINTLFLQGSAGGGGGSGASYIDKKVTFLSSTTWTVPKGVSQLTFTLYGAGGGGGGGYGKTGSEDCPYIKLPNMADNGRDLCYFNKNMDNQLGYGPNGTGLYIAHANEVSTMEATCHRDINLRGTYYTAPGGMNVANRMVCSQSGTNMYCGCYLPGSLGWNGPQCSDSLHVPKHMTRMLSYEELNRIAQQSPAPNYKYLTPQYLDYGGYYTHSFTNKFSSVSVSSNCPFSGGAGRSCNVYLHGKEGHIWLDGSCNPAAEGCARETIKIRSGDNKVPGIPICVYEIRDWYPYGAGGGATGAKLTQTIQVLPNDTLEITIGSGGSGGNAGNTGSTGGQTTIIHKRAGVQKGVYYAKGGIGGFKATSSGPGAATTTVASCSSGGACTRVVTTNDGKGNAGSETSGGSGAGGASGGLPDSAQGAAAANNTSYGGGGAFCPRGSKSPSSCSRGGNGGSGKAEVSYRIMLPGSGGGSATRVGGINADNKAYEIKYKVEEGSRVVFTIGAGGAGGSLGQDGISGTSTTVGNNDIVFLAGGGAKSVTQTQMDSLSSCIGSTTSSSVVAQCLNNASYKPQVGIASTINQKNEIQTNALGLLINNSSKVSYTVTANFKANNGKTSTQVNTTSIIPWSYGFDGGSGGAPFGISKTNIPAAIACGGGMKASYGTTTDVNSYVCTSGSINGNDAKGHDPANNEFGGSGGGGGGIIENSTTLGSGGSGSNGYLRIRWDESEQE